MEYSLLDMQKNVRHNPCCRGAQYLDRQTNGKIDRNSYLYTHTYLNTHNTYI